MKKIILKVLFYLSFFQSIAQTSITVTGGAWMPSVSTITEAGNDYALSSLSSSSNHNLITVTVPSGFFFFGTSYTVQIKRTDSGSNWNTAGLTISAIRTGNGTGGGSTIFGSSTITGGTAFQGITTTNQNFFGGTNYSATPRTSIPIQYKIDGISVLVPVANYTTTITYTLTAN